MAPFSARSGRVSRRPISAASRPISATTTSMPAAAFQAASRRIAAVSSA
ncbi:MAG: hypothetical protein PGN33_13515 [Methylobacterium radiotolerans]